jgi:hypothetical protein
VIRVDWIKELKVGDPVLVTGGHGDRTYKSTIQKINKTYLTTGRHDFNFNGRERGRGYMKRMILPYDPANPGLLETMRENVLNIIGVEIKDVSLETAREILDLIRLKAAGL